jgi:Peptidase family M13
LAEQALAMVHHIRRAFLERVGLLEWMDDETKLAAKEKALAMTEFIGFPDWFANSTALNHYYEGVSCLLNISRGENSSLFLVGLFDQEFSINERDAEGTVLIGLASERANSR